jgi:hypothetical protein
MRIVVLFIATLVIAGGVGFYLYQEMLMAGFLVRGWARWLVVGVLTVQRLSIRLGLRG